MDSVPVCRMGLGVIGSGQTGASLMTTPGSGKVGLNQPPSLMRIPGSTLSGGGGDGLPESGMDILRRRVRSTFHQDTVSPVIAQSTAKVDVDILFTSNHRVDPVVVRDRQVHDRGCEEP